MDKEDMLERVTKAARRAYVKGFAAGSGGNVSIRIQGQMYISPSGDYLGDLTTEGMIMFEAGGFMPSAGGSNYGGRRPLKEAGMHLTCCGSRPDILCLFHLHSSYFIAVACHRQKDRDPAMRIPAYTPGCATCVGRAPVIPYYRPGGRELTETAFGMMYRRDSPLLVNHDMVAAGKSPEAALAIAEEIGESAHLAVPSGDQGIPLDEEQTEVLFQAGGEA